MNPSNKKIIIVALLTTFFLNASFSLHAQDSSLPVPVNLRVTGTTYKSVALSWDYTPGLEDGLILEVNGVPIARLVRGTRSYNHHDGLGPESPYTYRIRTYKGESGFSAHSNTVTASTKSLPIILDGTKPIHEVRKRPDNTSDTWDDSKEWSYRMTEDKIWLDNTLNSGAPGFGSLYSALGTDQFKGASNRPLSDCTHIVNYTAHCTGDPLCLVTAVTNRQFITPGASFCLHQWDLPSSNISVPFPMNGELFTNPDLLTAPTNDVGGIKNACDYMNLPHLGTPHTFTSDYNPPLYPEYEKRSAQCLDSSHVKKTREYNASCAPSDEGNTTNYLRSAVSTNARRVETCPGSYPICVAGPEIGALAFPPPLFPGAECQRCTHYEDGYDVLKANPPKVAYIDIASTKFEFDPKYIEDTLRGRKFTPSKPFSPFDDFYIEIKMNLCPFAGRAAPGNLGLKSWVEVETPTGPVTVIHGTPQSFVKSKETATEAWYKWNFVGWGNGAAGIARKIVQQPGQPFVDIPDQRLMDILVDGIANQRTIYVVVEDSAGGRARFTMPQLDSCVHAWGNDKAPHKAVSMRGKSIAAVYTPVPGGDVTQTGMSSHDTVLNSSVVVNAFGSTAPFNQGTYMSSFSFYSDLKVHDDTGWLSGLLGYRDYKKPQKVSSCNARIGLGRLYYFNNDLPPEIWYPRATHVSPWGGRNLFMRYKFTDGSGILHETGHAFGSLSDEYTEGTPPVAPFNNCVANPNLFYRYPIGTGPLYGETTIQGCTNSTAYRPSESSLMNSGVDLRFNAISCGYIMKEILGKGTAGQYWPECSRMDGIIKPAALQNP